jgi:hypothetical protein
VSNLEAAEETPEALVTVTACAEVDGLIDPFVDTTFILAALLLLTLVTVTIDYYLVTSGDIVTMPSTTLDTTLDEETSSKSYTYLPAGMPVLVFADIASVIVPALLVDTLNV